MPNRLLVALIAGTLLLSGCELITPASPSIPRDSAATETEPVLDETHYPDPGTEITPESPFWTEFAPEPTPGMTWVYEGWSERKTGTFRATVTLKVLAVNEGTVTYRYENAAESGEVQSGEAPAELARYRGYPETGSHTFVAEGTESISVPAGTYSVAVKLVERTHLDVNTMWVVKGIGRVKVTYMPANESSPTIPGEMSLKQFIRP